MTEIEFDQIVSAAGKNSDGHRQRQALLRSYVLNSGWPPTFPRTAAEKAPNFPDVSWLQLDAPSWKPGSRDTIRQQEAALRGRARLSPSHIDATPNAENHPAAMDLRHTRSRKRDRRNDEASSFGDSPRFAEGFSSPAAVSCSAASGHPVKAVSSPAADGKLAQGGRPGLAGSSGDPQVLSSETDPASDSAAFLSHHQQPSSDTDSMGHGARDSYDAASADPDVSGQNQGQLGQQGISEEHAPQPETSRSKQRLQKLQWIKAKQHWVQANLHITPGSSTGAAERTCPKRLDPDVEQAMNEIRLGETEPAMARLQAASQRMPDDLTLMVLVACVQAQRDGLQHALSTIAKVLLSYCLRARLDNLYRS